MVQDYDSIQDCPKSQSNAFFDINPNQRVRYKAAETTGIRPYQEDAMFLANSSQIDNPQQYFRHHFEAMVSNNKSEKAGTTAALYYFDPAKRQITTANLGDSRVYLTIKNPATGEYKTILLTEDHNPNLPRVEAEVKRKEGVVLYYGGFRVNGVLMVGGAIGDKDLPLLIDPDIWTFDINDLAKKAFGDDVDISMLEFNIINACDGLTNHARDNNYDIGAIGTSTTGSSADHKLNNSESVHKNNLSQLVLQCPDGSDLALYLRDDANENVPGDNISVSTFSFTGAELSEAGKLQPTLGGIFDGHGVEKGEKVAQNCVQYMKEHYKEVGVGVGIEASVPAPLPPSAKIDPKIAAEGKIAEAIRKINFAITNASINQERDLDQPCQELNAAIRELVDLTGGITYEDIAHLSLGKDAPSLDGSSNLLINGQPAVDYLKERYKNTALIEYKKTTDYKRQEQVAIKGAVSTYLSEGAVQIDATRQLDNIHQSIFDTSLEVVNELHLALKFEPEKYTDDNALTPDLSDSSNVDKINDAIRRGKMFANYLYDDENSRKVLQKELEKRVVNHDCSENIVFDDGDLLSPRAIDVINQRSIKDSFKRMIEGSDLSKVNRIIYPANISQTHWVTGEIVINHNEEEGVINVTSYLHDQLFPARTMQDDSLDALQNVLQEKFPGTTVSTKTEQSPYREKRQFDGTSCGSIVPREMVKILHNEQLTDKYQIHAPELRIEDFQNKCVTVKEIDEYYRQGDVDHSISAGGNSDKQSDTIKSQIDKLIASSDKLKGVFTDITKAIAMSVRDESGRLREISHQIKERLGRDENEIDEDYLNQIRKIIFKNPGDPLAPEREDENASIIKSDVVDAVDKIIKEMQEGLDRQEEGGHNAPPPEHEDNFDYAAAMAQGMREDRSKEGDRRASDNSQYSDPDINDEKIYNYVHDIKAPGAEEHNADVEAIKEKIKSNTRNPNPTDLYRGVGIKATFNEDEELVIDEIFSPEEFGRFTIKSFQGGDETETLLTSARDSSSFFKDSTITEIAGQKISDLIKRDDCLEQIAQFFHGEGEVSFKIVDKHGDEYSISCDNSKNKTSLFAATNTDSPDPKFTTLSKGIELNDGKLQGEHSELLKRIIAESRGLEGDRSPSKSPQPTDSGRISPDPKEQGREVGGN